MTFTPNAVYMEEQHPEWLIPLTSEQQRGYTSVTHSWTEQRMGCIDECLDRLFESERADPAYLLLPKDDFVYLHWLIIWGTNICGHGDYWETAIPRNRPWYFNQTTGGILTLVVDTTLAPLALKFLYRVERESRA
jgi:hypothetical protein